MPDATETTLVGFADDTNVLILDEESLMEKVKVYLPNCNNKTGDILLLCYSGISFVMT